MTALPGGRAAPHANSRRARGGRRRGRWAGHVPGLRGPSAPARAMREGRRAAATPRPRGYLQAPQPDAWHTLSAHLCVTRTRTGSGNGGGTGAGEWRGLGTRTCVASAVPVRTRCTPAYLPLYFQLRPEPSRLPERRPWLCLAPGAAVPARRRPRTVCPRCGTRTGQLLPSR